MKPYATKVHLGMLTMMIISGLIINFYSLFGFARPVLAADFTCTYNSSVDGSWNNALNWSDCNGEYPGYGSNTSYDVVIPEGHVAVLTNDNIDLTAGTASGGNVTVSGMLFTEGFSLTLLSMSINSGGYVFTGSSNITVKGNWIDPANGFNSDTSTVNFIGQSYDFNGVFNDVNLSGGAANLVEASSFACRNLNLNSGSFSTHNSGVFLSGNLTLANNTTWIKGNETNWMAFGSGDHHITDNNATKQDIGEIGSNESDNVHIIFDTDAKVTAINAVTWGEVGYQIDISNRTITVTGVSANIPDYAIYDHNDGAEGDGATFITTGSTLVLATSGSYNVNLGETQIFNNIEIQNGTVTTDNPINLTGDFILTSGTYNSNGKNLNVGGNLAIASGATFTKGGTLTFDGTAAKTFTDSNASLQNIGTVVLNKTNGTASNNKLTLASNMKADIVTVSANNTLDLGASSYTLELANAGDVANVLTVNGTLVSGTSTVKYSATNSGGNVNVATLPYSSLQFSPASAETYDMTGHLTDTNDLTGSLTINANATFNTYVGTTSYDLSSVNVVINASGTLYAGTNGSVGTSTIVASGNFTKTGTFTYGKSHVNLTGTGSTAGTFYDLTAAAAGKTTTITANSGITHTLTLGSGVVTANGNTLYLTGSGTPYVTQGTTFTSNNAIISYGATAPTNVTAATYPILKIQGGSATFSAAGDITAARLDLEWSNLGTTPVFDTNNHSLTINGNVTVGTANQNRLATFKPTGSAPVTVNGNVSILAGTTGSLNKIDLSEYSGTFTVKGNWSNADTFTAGTSATVDFAKTSNTQTLNSGGTGTGKDFYNLTHSGAGSLQLLNNDINIANDFTNSAGTFTTLDGANSRNMTVGNDFTISSGEFSANNSQISVGGNWLDTGTFVSGTSEVTLTGDGVSIGNSSGFKNLIINTDGTILAEHFVVGGTLVITNGSLSANGQIYINSLGSNTVTVGDNGNLTGSGELYFDTPLPNIVSEDTGSISISKVTFSANYGDTLTIPSFHYSGNGSVVLEAYLNSSPTKTYTLAAGIFTCDGDLVLQTKNGAVGAHFVVENTNNTTINIGGDWITDNNGSGDIAYTHGTETVNFTGDSTQTVDGSAGAFNNLTHSGSGTLQAQSAIDINGNFVNSNGIFDASGYNINVAKNWNISGGSFSTGSEPGSQTVTLDSANTALVSGSTTFNNLTFDTTDGNKEIDFTAGTTQTVSGDLIFNTTSNLLTMRSTSPETAYTLAISEDIAGPVEKVDVQDNAVTGGTITPSHTNSINSGRNTGWLFNQTPNAPSSLGPSQYIDGTWTNDNTPDLTFTLSDPDASDQVKYQIQICSSVDFLTPEIDYISSLQDQGPASYTANPALDDGSYFWRVKTIDERDSFSDWTTAAGVESIYIDTSLPTADGISINAGAVYATSRTVSISITNASDTGSDLKEMSFSNNNSTWSDYETYGATKNDWEMSAGDDTKTVYLKLKDNAGNVTTAEISDSIILDSTNPSGTISINSGEEYTNNIATSLTITGIDTNGLAQMKISNNADLSGSEWEAFSEEKAWNISESDGTKTVYIQYKDNAGNTSNAISDAIILDTAFPTVSNNVSGTLGSNGYYKTAAPTISLTANDGSGSGVSSILYRFGTSGDFEAYSSAVVAPEGTNTLSYYATDMAGNSGSASPNSLEIKVDSISPVSSRSISPATANGLDGWYKDDAPIVTLSGTDQTSGFASIKYRWGDDDYVTYETALTAPSGINTLYYYAEDNAGNASEVASITIKLDITNPSASEITPSATSPTNNLTVPFIWDAAIDQDSGIDHYLVYIGTTTGGIDIANEVETSTNSFTQTFSETGTYYIRVKAVDKMGYVSDYSQEGSVLIDQTNPILTINNLTNNMYVTTKSFTINGTATDFIPGIERILLKIDNKDWVDATLTSNNWSYSWQDFTEGNHTIVAKAVDKASNEQASTEFKIIVDTVAPTQASDLRIFNISNTSSQIFSAYLDFGESIDETSNMSLYEIYRDGTKIKDIIPSKDTSNSNYFGSNLQSYFFIDENLLEKSYNYIIRSIDNAGNSSETQTLAIDLKSDTISDNQITDIKVIPSKVIDSSNKTSAVVFWHTALPSTTQVAYGASNSYGQMSDEDKTLNQSHTVLLKDLNPATTYHLQLNSKDTYNREIKSDDVTFTTTIVPKKDNVINLIVKTLQQFFNSIFQASADAAESSSDSINNLREFSSNLQLTDISFSTKGINQFVLTYPKDSKVYRSENNSNFNLLPTTGSIYVDRNLNSNTSYQYRIDESEAIVRKPVVGDDSALIIVKDPEVIKESVIVDEKNGQLMLKWQTSRSSTSQIEFGTSTSYGQKTKVDESLNKSHAMMLEELTPGTTYHLRAISEDTKGNIVSSSDIAYTLPNKPVKETPVDIVLRTLNKLMGLIKHLV